MLLEDIA